MKPTEKTQITKEIRHAKRINIPDDKIHLILIVFQGISHSQKPFVLPFFFQPALFLSGNEATI